ncbi:MAG: hypothetical protein HKP25_14435 [Marinicaulis sp.]|nr:hypothetical protein [Marinicaulis sp.]
MIALALIAAGYAAYGAPSNEDAYVAFTARVMEPWAETGDVIREAEIRTHPEFPAAVVLERCENRVAREIVPPLGGIEVTNGYECIQEIILNGSTRYRNVGFYRHQGLNWEYYGPVQESNIPMLSRFSKPRRGEEEAKPGALTYDGAPEDPFNAKFDNPYADILERLDAYTPTQY